MDLLISMIIIRSKIALPAPDQTLRFTITINVRVPLTLPDVAVRIGHGNEP